MCGRILAQTQICSLHFKYVQLTRPEQLVTNLPACLAHLLCSTNNTTHNTLQSVYWRATKANLKLYANFKMHEVPQRHPVTTSYDLVKRELCWFYPSHSASSSCGLQHVNLPSVMLRYYILRHNRTHTPSEGVVLSNKVLYYIMYFFF